MAKGTVQSESPTKEPKASVPASQAVERTDTTEAQKAPEPTPKTKEQLESELRDFVKVKQSCASNSKCFAWHGFRVYLGLPHFR